MPNSEPNFVLAPLEGMPLGFKIIADPATLNNIDTKLRIALVNLRNVGPYTPHPNFIAIRLSSEPKIGAQRSALLRVVMQTKQFIRTVYGPDVQIDDSQMPIPHSRQQRAARKLGVPSTSYRRLGDH